MGDGKRVVGINIAIGEPNTALRAALEALADEHGDQALASEFALWAIDQQLPRRKAGRPAQYFWKDANGQKRWRTNLLEAVWIAVEMERYRRKKGVRPALDDLFKELRGEPWVIDLGDVAAVINSSSGKRPDRKSDSRPSARARNLYLIANRLRRDPKIRKDWDRSLETAKKIIDENWTVEIIDDRKIRIGPKTRF